MLLLIIMESQAVEVLDFANSCWLEADILDIDIKNRTFTVRYKHAKGNTIESEIPHNRIRLPPTNPTTTTTFKEGDQIEVFTQLPWKEGLQGWWKATIVKTKTNYALLKIQSGSITFDLIEVKDAFRSSCKETCFDLEGLFRGMYKIDDLDKKSMKTLESIKSSSKCKIVTFFEEDSRIVVIGDAKSISSAKAILMEIFHIPSEDNKEQITLSNYLALKVKGKSNTKLAYLEGQYKVKITEEADSNGITFSIKGAKRTEAKEAINIHEEVIKLNSDSMRYFYGMTENEYHKYFFERNIMQFIIDEKASTIKVIGNEKSLQELKDSLIKIKPYKKKY